jgi:hypothetical protein
VSFGAVAGAHPSEEEKKVAPATHEAQAPLPYL